MQSFFISFFVNTVVISYFSLALKSKFKVITNCHQKKLTNLREQQERKISKSMTTYVKNTVHNFSSYQLTTEEYTALSYGLDRHIPCKFSSNRIRTEFEQFYQSILKDISQIPESDL